MPQANGVTSHTNPGAQVPSTSSAAAKSNATESDSTAQNGDTATAESVSSGWLDWGHGHRGETCCMCSYQYGGPKGTVVLYAA